MHQNEPHAIAQSFQSATMTGLPLTGLPVTASMAPAYTTGLPSRKRLARPCFIRTRGRPEQ